MPIVPIVAILDVRWSVGAAWNAPNLAIVPSRSGEEMKSQSRRTVTPPGISFASPNLHLLPQLAFVTAILTVMVAAEPLPVLYLKICV